MSKPNIVLIIEGGLVQAAYADGEVGEITVLDADTGTYTDDSELVWVKDQGYLISSPGEAVIDPVFVQEVKAAVDAFYEEEDEN